MIVDAIRAALIFQPEDVLLDLGCGNGALAAQLFPFCAGYLGVDVSEALIGVARQNFAQPDCSFVINDVTEYVVKENAPEKFTKALCYGSFACLHPVSAYAVLSSLAARFQNLGRLFIGNLPDFDRVKAFYPDCSVDDPILWNPLSPIGIWRTPQEFLDLAEAAGWSAQLTVMPPSFHAAHYRYDALLTRKA